MSELNLSLFRGQLVRLAAPQPDDAKLFSRWSENAVYMRLVDTDYARPMSAEVVAEREKAHGSGPNAVTFHLRTIKDDSLIGFVSLHSIEWNNQTALMSIGIGEPDYWGKGYGLDAMRLILRYAFYELNLHRVGLHVSAYNTRAIRLYEKVGFKHEGSIRDFIFRDGQRYDDIFMGILRDEWRVSQPPSIAPLI